MNINDPIGTLRKSYETGELVESQVPEDPLALFAEWMQTAVAYPLEEANAMTLCTVDGEGQPQGRIVLLRGVSEEGFTFFTNYESAKGQQVEGVGKAALVFFWQPLERQIRIAGEVRRIAEAQSDAYFASRPRGHQLSAWTSPQSRTVAGRTELEERLAAVEARFPGEVPRPPFWGGYVVRPQRIEFWQGRKNRLHDRLVYSRGEAGWQRTRLAP